MDNSVASSGAMGRATSRELRRRETDVVIAITVPSVVAMLDTDSPVVHVNDNTFRLLKGYYRWGDQTVAIVEQVLAAKRRRH